MNDPWLSSGDHYNLVPSWQDEEDGEQENEVEEDEEDVGEEEEDGEGRCQLNLLMSLYSILIQ